MSHSPTLQSIKMVEETIKTYSQEYSKYQLWKRLPKKMMYQTYCEIFDYLQESGKFFVDKENIVIYTWNPAMVKKIRDQNLIIK